MELYREDGRKAGLYDVCEWWIETYPPDVFVNEPKPIVEARMCIQNILIKRVRVVPSSNIRKPQSAGWVCIKHNNLVDNGDECRLCEEDKADYPIIAVKKH